MRNAFIRGRRDGGCADSHGAVTQHQRPPRLLHRSLFSRRKSSRRPEHIPLHLGLMSSVIKSTLQIFPFGYLQPGDAIITNDPCVSGSRPGHLHPLPLFHDGACLGILANLAHHVDVGGIAPGGMPTISTEIFQEGLRIPPVRIRKAGVVDQEVRGPDHAQCRTSREARRRLSSRPTMWASGDCMKSSRSMVLSRPLVIWKNS